MSLQQFGCFVSFSPNPSIHKMLLSQSHRLLGIVPHLQDQWIELCQTIRAKCCSHSPRVLKNFDTRGENHTDRNTAFPWREQSTSSLPFPTAVHNHRASNTDPFPASCSFSTMSNLVVNLLASQERTDQLVKNVDFQLQRCSWV